MINIDLSFPFLEYAKKHHSIQGVQADISQLPFKAQRFDTVVSYGVVVYVDNHSFDNLLHECCRVLKPDGVVLLHEAVEYVRWYKTYLRLLHLRSFEPAVSRLYEMLAKLRGYQLPATTSDPHSQLALYLRDQIAYEKALRKAGFTSIAIRPTFVNIAPPSFEKYFYSLTYHIAPLFKKKPSVYNGLLVSAQKPSYSEFSK